MVWQSISCDCNLNGRGHNPTSHLNGALTAAEPLICRTTSLSDQSFPFINNSGSFHFRSSRGLFAMVGKCLSFALFLVHVSFALFLVHVSFALFLVRSQSWRKTQYFIKILDGKYSNVERILSRKREVHHFRVDKPCPQIVHSYALALVPAVAPFTVGKIWFICIVFVFLRTTCGGSVLASAFSRSREPLSWAWFNILNKPMWDVFPLPLTDLQPQRKLTCRILKATNHALQILQYPFAIAKRMAILNYAMYTCCVLAYTKLFFCRWFFYLGRLLSDMLKKFA